MCEDKNVFDIIEGVSLIFMREGKRRQKTARVFHADLLGTRRAKYKKLAETDGQRNGMAE